MRLLWEDRAWEDYLYWQTQDKKTLKRINALIRDIQRHENVKIPEDFDYSPIEMITLEAREKLQKIRPRTLAQAGRIPGVSPSDLAQLSIVLLKQK